MFTNINFHIFIYIQLHHHIYIILIYMMLYAKDFNFLSKLVIRKLTNISIECLPSKCVVSQLSREHISVGILWQRLFSSHIRVRKMWYSQE